jgi:SAM-dependent methyltransferase
MRRYPYENRSQYAGSHHDALSNMLDPLTKPRIGELVEGNLRGKHCLDVGAGGGSIARWLANEVRPGGLVCATDIDTAQLPEWSHQVVLQHDITEGPVPSHDGFDLVHARTVLNHLGPRAELALQHMVQSLRPGGVLLIADFWPTRLQEFVVGGVSEADGVLLRRFLHFHLETLRRYGNDRTWSKRAAAAVEAQGLVDVRQVIYPLGNWRGGGAGCRLLLAGMRQRHEDLLIAGLGFEALRRLELLLGDPDVDLKGFDLYSVSGRKEEE